MSSTLLAVFLRESVKVEVVWRFWYFQSEKLLPVVVHVGLEPAPVAVANVVKVLKATLSIKKDFFLLNLIREVLVELIP